MALGSALDFDEAAAIVHHHIHVGVADGIFRIVQVQYRLTLIDADRDGRYRTDDRVALQAFVQHQLVDGIDQGDISAGDRCGAGTAVGLQDIAVQGDHAFTQRLAVDAGAQAAPDQALDFHRPSTLAAAGGFALAAASSSMLAVHSTWVSP
ncbi:hypothetical protein RF55_17930 [Lasius niger]|uniref:Uncharacterized protein n=1 Tax=Lasius niger TaxID=67767 RepID=A0A0J7MV18_LASNI|nr:hypothetical protein RF55_17930 [Lasius niger]